MSALRDNGGYIGHYPLLPSGVFSLNAVSAKILALKPEVVAAYSTTNASGTMSTTITDIVAGDQILAFVCSDNAVITASGVWTEEYSRAASSHAMFWSAVAASSGDAVYTVDSSGDQRVATVFLHCRGLDLTDIAFADLVSSGADFDFPALAAQTGDRLVIAAGFLDDDLTTELDPAPPGGYVGQAASQGSLGGASMHVYSKETDGSAESALSIDHTASDAWVAVVFSIGFA